ncbi:RNA-directed DNA polymerase-like protein [Gossypium australe]|uniref:RNA-directed DNA polymerase-like protein n=1 Tax=Gossypium australe TaxID=47621 RepID=A0A5B6VP51_9ROSI|nr:RNA-directed DNA polymerase-like protein [Gossypium australe]
MAPAELKKLEAQLQELLDKGFIRPSLTLNHDGFVLAELKTRPLFLQKIQELQNENLKLIAK